MTFEREVMGALCLAIVWGNTLLIGAHALSEWRSLRRLKKRLVPALPGRVGLAFGRPGGRHPRTRRASDQPGEPGGGEELGQKERDEKKESMNADCLACYRLEQVARTRGDGKIHFHDRRTESVVEGGWLVLDPGVGEHGPGAAERGKTTTGGSAPGEAPAGTPSIWIEAAPPERSWVWPHPREVKRRLQCPGVDAFDQLAKSAARARGVERPLEVELGESEPIYVVGRLSDDGTRMAADPDGVLLVSAIDPRSWLNRKSLLILAILVAIFAVAGFLTVLATWPPVFGVVSQVGAVGLLLYFLLVQPVGVWLTEKIQLPHVAAWRGSWDRNRVGHLSLPSDGASVAAVSSN